ncbi:hypothetical protein FB451DRAFT_1446704 [Mycena latifolia]|nr:hypothetical protein FB451DRAFT_1446704 [Mycena latifolia]
MQVEVEPFPTPFDLASHLVTRAARAQLQLQLNFSFNWNIIPLRLNFGGMCSAPRTTSFSAPRPEFPSPGPIGRIYGRKYAMADPYIRPFLPLAPPLAPRGAEQNGDASDRNSCVAATRIPAPPQARCRITFYNSYARTRRPSSPSRPPPRTRNDTSSCAPAPLPQCHGAPPTEGREAELNEERTTERSPGYAVTLLVVGGARWGYGHSTRHGALRCMRANGGTCPGGVGRRRRGGLPPCLRSPFSAVVLIAHAACALRETQNLGPPLVRAPPAAGCRIDGRLRGDGRSELATPRVEAVKLCGRLKRGLCVEEQGARASSAPHVRREPRHALAGVQAPGMDAPHPHGRRTPAPPVWRGAMRLRVPLLPLPLPLPAARLRPRPASWLARTAVRRAPMRLRGPARVHAGSGRGLHARRSSGSARVDTRPVRRAWLRLRAVHRGRRAPSPLGPACRARASRRAPVHRAFQRCAARAPQTACISRGCTTLEDEGPPHDEEGFAARPHARANLHVYSHLHFPHLHFTRLYVRVDVRKGSWLNKFLRNFLNQEGFSEKPISHGRHVHSSSCTTRFNISATNSNSNYYLGGRSPKLV